MNNLYTLADNKSYKNTSEMNFSPRVHAPPVILIKNPIFRVHARVRLL